MKKIFFGILVLLVGLNLGGCSPAKQQDYRYFVLHPLELQSAIQQCELLGAEMVRANPTCLNAFKASKTVEGYYNELRVPNGQQAFGAKILHDQMKLVSLNEKYQHTEDAQEKSHIKTQIDNLQFTIDARRAILGYFFSLSQ